MEHYEKWQQILSASFDQFMTALGAYLPSLISALVLILTGILLAFLCRWLIIRLGQGIDRIVQRLGINTHYYLNIRWPISKVIANITYWLIILFFLTAAAESLGLPGIAEWLGKLIIYLPSILFAVLIIWFGFVLGAVARDKVSHVLTGTSIRQSEKIGAGVRILVIFLTIIIGLGQLGVKMTLVEDLLIVIAAAIGLALAIAFGLGAGLTAGNIIAVRNIKKHYQKGQRVRIQEIEGTIIELSKTAIILDTDNGRTMVPAKIFQEQASILLDQETL